MAYATGYNGTTRTREQLLAWSQFIGMDDEFARRVLALMDASIANGTPLGIGGTLRSSAGQTSLFLSRHHEVTFGGCCTYMGKRYALNRGAAHAAPPGKSYHEPTTRSAECLAIDWLGDARAFEFLRANCAKYGLNEFLKVNGEPWHSQPRELPLSRSGYTMGMTLQTILLPGTPAPAPTRVLAPVPTLKQRVGLLAGKNDATRVRALQYQCNFWGWRDSYGRTLLVDGDFGAKTAQAVIAMQRALHQTADGQYGPYSAAALQRFLDAMTAMAAA